VKSFVVTPRARADLDACAEYLARDSLLVMERFLAHAKRTFEYLASNPGVGSTQPSKDRRLRDIRKWAVEGFPNVLVFYRSTSRGIEIVRVYHAARDPNQLFDRS
jgi:toxin ParE1/3/4